MAYFYFSFVHPTAPKGDQWKGACYIEGKSFTHALQKSHDLGINPGGEILSIELSDFDNVKPEYINRLLNESELRESSKCGDRVLLNTAGEVVPEKS